MSSKTGMLPKRKPFNYFRHSQPIKAIEYKGILAVGILLDVPLILDEVENVY